VTYANFRCEKDKLTVGYRKLAKKHKSLTERTEHKKAKLVEAHAAEVTQLREDWDLKSTSYTKYRHTVHRQLRDLHKAVASTFEEVKAQCLPFPDKGVKVEEMIE
jgi:hypothetical protein